MPQDTNRLSIRDRCYSNVFSTLPMDDYREFDLTWKADNKEAPNWHDREARPDNPTHQVG
jgi:hypothetical protein